MALDELDLLETKAVLVQMVAVELEDQLDGTVNRALRVQPDEKANQALQEDRVKMAAMVAKVPRENRDVRDPQEPLEKVVDRGQPDGKELKDLTVLKDLMVDQVVREVLVDQDAMAQTVYT